MVMNIERPLDFLDGKKGKEVLLQVKDQNGIIKGKLIAFDIHINIVIEIKGTHRFIRGDQILWVE